MVDIMKMDVDLISGKGAHLPNIYHVDIQLERCFDPETGELLFPDAYADLQVERSRCVSELIGMYKNTLLLCDDLKRARQEMGVRLTAAKGKAERLKKLISESLNGQTFNCANGRVSYRQVNNVVVVDDVSKLPERFLRFHDPEPDKDAIKRALVAGGDSFEIEGAHLESHRATVIQ